MILTVHSTHICGVLQRLASIKISSTKGHKQIVPEWPPQFGKAAAGKQEITMRTKVTKQKCEMKKMERDIIMSKVQEKEMKSDLQRSSGRLWSFAELSRLGCL